MSPPAASRECLALVINHPIQYHAPLYAHPARDGRFELRVFYMTDRGARQRVESKFTWDHVAAACLETYGVAG